MSVSTNIACPSCGEVLKCNVDLEVNGSKREAGGLVMNVNTNFTGETKRRIQDHIASQQHAAYVNR